MSKLDGFLTGNSWNKETRKFEIKTLGTRESGAILCGLSVSSKDQDGNRVYGLNVPVKINIKSESEGGRVMGLINEGKLVEFEGMFVAQNWTNQEGKEIRGNQFLVFDSTTLVPKGVDKPKVETKQVDDAPFETKPADNKRDIPDW